MYKLKSNKRIPYFNFAEPSNVLDYADRSKTYKLKNDFVNIFYRIYLNNNNSKNIWSSSR